MRDRGAEINSNIKIVIIMCAVLLVCLFLSLILSIKQDRDRALPDASSLNTIRDVVEYHGSKYISEKDSEVDGYYKDVNVVFKVEPYVEETDEINRDYYETLLEEIAKVISYKSYIIMDDEKGITIKVICKEGRLDRIILNDIEDYFTYVESLVSAKNYKKINEVELEVSDAMLNEVIGSGWESGYDFGEKNSLFCNYEIYLDRGIRVRKIQNKIYNIVYTRRYEGDIIKNISTSNDVEQVKRSLGKPSFEDEEMGIVGYKSKDFYVFFGNNEISVYRTYSGDTSEFFELADEYLKDNYTNSDLLNFMNELTYKWKDYSVYEYTNSSVYLSYPLKGIEIKINYDNENGILIYNNIKSGLTMVKNHLENTSYTSKLQIDCVFEAEKRRRNDRKELEENAKGYMDTMNEEKDHRESLDYDIYPLRDSNDDIYSMKFISQTDDLPDRELNDTISDFIWEDSRHFVYTKAGNGSYRYDLESGHVSTTMDEEFLEEIRTREE